MNVKASKWNNLRSWEDCCSLFLIDPLLKKMCYRVFMDNFLISFWLLKFLATNNISASGTMWENRFSQRMISKMKAIDKFEHGAIDYQTSAQNNVAVVEWKDNKSVYAASVSHIQQWNRQKQANYQPFLINR